MSSFAVFADESGTGERYLVFGAVFVPAEHVAAVEAELEEFCAARGAAGREMSWKKCSRRKVDRYCGFVNLFQRLAKDYGIEFRAMVVDVYQTSVEARCVRLGNA